MVRITTPTALPGALSADPSDTTAATRYLCAAAHLDAEFPHRVVEELFEQQHRAVGPSYGIDLVPILGHCFAARRRRLVRDVFVLLGVLVSSGFNLFALLTVGLLAMVWRYMVRELRSPSPIRQALARGLLVGLAPAVLIGAVVVAVIGFLVAGLATFAAGDDGGQASIGESLASTVGPLLILGTFQALLIWLPVFVERQVARRAVAKLRAGRFDPGATTSDIPHRLAQRLRALAEAQFGNTTVYGRFQPFVGAGEELDGWGWSDTVDLSKRKEAHDDRAAAERFSVGEILGHVTERLKQRLESGDPRFPETSGFPIRIERRAFLNGVVVRGTSLLPDPSGPPSVAVDRTFMADLTDHPTAGRRHYLSIQVGQWGQEVVLTTFLHIDIKGSTLYVEAVVCVLHPIRAEYHRVDFMAADELSIAEQFDVLRSSIVAVPGVVLRAPGNILRTATTFMRAARKRRAVAQAVRDGRLVDYGARVSVRELGAADGFHEYFQVLDAVEAYKLTHRHIFDVILEFLDAKGIDTEEFRARQTTILNHGIMLGQGTILNQGNFAVGRGARAGDAQSGRGDQAST